MFYVFHGKVYRDASLLNYSRKVLSEEASHKLTQLP